MLLELVLDNTGGESFFGMTDDRWSQALYRLLFFEWFRDSDGWAVTQQYLGYAGPWEETFHLGLMLEDADYPYADDGRADLYRRAFWGQPKRQYGLASLLCGSWDPVPTLPARPGAHGFGGGVELAQLGQAAVRGDHRLEGPGLAVAPGVLAGLVDVEIVVGMLDHRDPLAGQLQALDQLFDQGGLAGTRPGAETDDLHA